MYDYCLEKQKVEKLSIQVDPWFEHFLKSLKIPLALNQMRTMKEPNYTKARELVRAKSGGMVMNLIRDNQEFLGLEPGIFDLVFEGFWDLYTFKPQTEISAKKLQTLFLPKLRLEPNESTGVPAFRKPKEAPKEGEEPPAEGDDDETEAKEPYEQISAVVRIRIAKKERALSEGSKAASEKQEQEDDGELSDMPIDDKALAITTYNDGTSVYVIN